MSQQLKNRLDRIERRLAEAQLRRKEAKCNCRGPGKPIPDTTFHTPEELERILAVPCPVHGVRNLGFVMYAAKWVPIKEPDWEFCDCPPDIWRDLQMGRIPLPADPEAARRRKEEIKHEERERLSREAEAGLTPPKRGYKAMRERVGEILRKHAVKMAAQGGGS